MLPAAKAPTAKLRPDTQLRSGPGPLDSQNPRLEYRNRFQHCEVAILAATLPEAPVVQWFCEMWIDGSHWKAKAKAYHVTPAKGNRSDSDSEEEAQWLVISGVNGSLVIVGQGLIF